LHNTITAIYKEVFKLSLFLHIIQTVLYFLKADWHILLIGILLAVGVNVYSDPHKLRGLLVRRAGLSIPGAVLFGALTPLCACGTMAVLISMFVSAMPWGAVMAFLVSSPLTSPSEFMFETAFLGTHFAVAMLISSVALGISAGFLAHYLEKNTSLFKGQFRLGNDKTQTPLTEAECCATAEPEASCCSPALQNNPSCSCNAKNAPWQERLKLKEFGQQFVQLGLKKVLLYFVLFIAVGALVERFIPTHLVESLFSEGRAYSIPLSATIGLPLYVSNSAALPLLRSLLNAGAGQGAILAFLIAGKATGVPVILGMSTFLKPKALAYYVGFIYFGSILAGFVLEFYLRVF